MRQDQFIYSSFFLTPVFLLLPLAVFADGYSEQETQPPVNETRTDEQTFDKRLPPVLPGAEVYQNGKKIRVITTAGPVPGSTVAPAPQPPQPAGNGPSRFSTDQLSVIVDQRSQPKTEKRSLGDAWLDEQERRESR